VLGTRYWVGGRRPGSLGDPEQAGGSLVNTTFVQGHGGENAAARERVAGSGPREQGSEAGEDAGAAASASQSGDGDSFGWDHPDARSARAARAGGRGRKGGGRARGPRRAGLGVGARARGPRAAAEAGAWTEVGGELPVIARDESASEMVRPPPPRVPHPVLIGHAASLTP